MTNTTNTKDYPEDKIFIGISSCLIGERVRYDGGHKQDRYITDVLSKYFEFVPFCPEVAIGLGIPRPVIRLQGTRENPRAVIADEDNRDITDALDSYGRHIGNNKSHISGYILKSRSPSCGMARVGIYDKNGIPANIGTGIYARALMAVQSLLPVEEEGRLKDADLRDCFIERVLVYHRWQNLIKGGVTFNGLVKFHTEHKFIIMAHEQEPVRKLGRLVANAKHNLPETAAEYISILMDVLRRPAALDTRHH